MTDGDIIIGTEALLDSISQFLVVGTYRQRSPSDGVSMPASAAAAAELEGEIGQVQSARAISRLCDSFVSEWEREKSAAANHKAKLDSFLSSLQSVSESLHRASIPERLKKISVLEANESVLRVAAALHELDSRGSEDHGAMVPGLVSVVLTALPSSRGPDSDPPTASRKGSHPAAFGPYRPVSLPKHAKICEYTKNISLKLQSLLFEDFNQQFDAILDVSGNGSKDIWENFLLEAEPKIVSYVLISLLPCVVGSASIDQCCAAFEAALGGMLGPLWARVYFHLGEARKKGTLGQFAWSMDYCKSVADVLIILVLRVSRDPAVQHMQSRCCLNNDGTCYVLNKMSKFVRAHIAEFMHILSPISTDQLLYMIECTLSFDDYVRRQGGGPRRGGDPGAVAVLCDAKGALDTWLAGDVAFLRQSLSGTFETREETMYSMKFCSVLANKCNSAVRSEWTTQLDIIFSHFRQPKELSCFRSVYECLWILCHICSPRYSSVPREYEHHVMARIVHPVLLLILGSLLRFVRSDAVLVALATADSLGTTCTARKEETLAHIGLLLQNVNYVSESFAFLSQDLFMSTAGSDILTFELQWAAWRKKLSFSSTFLKDDAGSSRDMVAWAFPVTHPEPCAHIGPAAAPAPAGTDSIGAPPGTATVLLKYCCQQMILMCSAVQAQYDSVVW